MCTKRIIISRLLFHRFQTNKLLPFTMTFLSSRRIDFPMVDSAGIVYYPRFWDLAHRFYEESWEYTCGIHYNEVLENHRLGFPLVHSEANFHHPLSYGDTATCKLKIKRIGNTSITWDFEIFNQDEILCWTSVQTTVCTSMDEITKKVSVPEWMREGLSKIQE
ncbi:acyl-CoA thioesterase [Euryarchaeota archaeon]|nr:acyl-CoA thioesterase [Euryarchaeota archaeon]